MKEQSGNGKKAVIKWVLLSAMLLIIYVLSTLPHIFWSYVSPDFLVVFAMSAAFYETPQAAAIIGAAAGLLKDIGSSGLMGFNGLCYLLAAVGISMLVMLLVRRTPLNSLLMSSAAVIAIKLFSYFIFNVLFEKGGRGALLLRSVIPSVLLTLVFVPVGFFAMKGFYRHFTEDE